MSILKKPTLPTEWESICYDLLNFSPYLLELRTMTPHADFPGLIQIPPNCMATIPHSNYQGRTAEGKNTQDVVAYFGAQRPLRNIINGAVMYDDGVYQMPKEWIAFHNTQRLTPQKCAKSKSKLVLLPSKPSAKDSNPLT